jgi:AraC-like DNA-binding protein
VKYTFEANRLGIVFFGQIVQYHHISDDFSGLFIVLSKRFGDNLELNIKDSTFQQHQRPETKMEELFTSFYNLVLLHHRESHEVGFYADKLCLTPKYLSTVIKASTGKTAYEWINDYVILEAKALLKSDMTVQQISDSLSFPNQSFFGQSFKRHTGMSPSEYRRK